MPEDMTITNPYRERAMIPIASELFFGRVQERQRISDLLSGDSPQCVSIVGERRIGKSSLAQRKKILPLTWTNAEMNLTNRGKFNIILYIVQEERC